MTKLEQLIKELCPNGVEILEIGEFAKVEKGKNKDKKCNLAYSITKGGLVPTVEYFKDAKVTSDDTSGYRIVRKNWFVYSPSRIDVGSINYLRDDIEIIVSPLNVVFSIDERRILPSYLLYFLGSRSGTWQILTSREGIEGTGRKLLPFDKFAKIKVPVPPIEIQIEIVKSLDIFSEYISKLEAELTARKKQYEYYRDLLLDFCVREGATGECERRTLGDVAEVTDYVANGSFASLRENVTYKRNPDFAALIRTVDFSNGFDRDQMIYIDENAYKFLEKSRLFGGEIIINNIGAGVGNSFLCPMLDIKMSLAPNAVMLKTSNNKFYFYWLNSKYGKNALSKIISKSAMPKFNKTGLRGIMIPVPPIDEQERIVSILDRFDKLCNDISEGLPAEIEARRKQYEYYRDKLLTFENKKQ